MRSVSSRRAPPPLRDRVGPRQQALAQVFGRPADADQLKLNLLGQITSLERDLTHLRERLLALEAASAPLTAALPPPPPPRSRRQTPKPVLAPLILSLLPADGELLALDEIISGVLAGEQADIDDRAARSKAYRRVNLCLSKLRAQGQVVSNRIGSGRLDWGLNPHPPTTDDQSGE